MAGPVFSTYKENSRGLNFKLLPGGHKVSWGIGALMIGWGVWMIMGVLL